jgi:hypothetical protein
MWIRRFANNQATVRTPGDNWIYPAANLAVLHFMDVRGPCSFSTIRFHQNGGARLITGISPNPARIGDNITVTGRNLIGGHFLLNGKVAELVSRSGNTVVLKAPENILTPTHYNLVWEKGEGEDRVATWPVVVTVDVPNNQMPHLVSASFSPTTVKVGELLKVTMTVRNNLPVPAGLTVTPRQPFTYDEKQAWYEMGYKETKGCLNLRVSTDFFVGGHHPGSWTWMFGFDNPVLKPGETTTVTGYIRLQTPGTHVFRIGLVAGGSRFIDDNAYQTRITVVP